MKRRGKLLVLSQKFKGHKVYLIILIKFYLFFFLPKYRAITTTTTTTKTYNICKSLRFMPVLVSMINYITHLPLEIILKLFY